MQCMQKGIFINIYICKHVIIIFTNFALKLMKTIYPLPSKIPGCAHLEIHVGFEVAMKIYSFILPGKYTHILAKSNVSFSFAIDQFLGVNGFHPL